jgi:hypothetical protein
VVQKKELDPLQQATILHRFRNPLLQQTKAAQTIHLPVIMGVCSLYKILNPLHAEGFLCSA